MSDPHGPLGLTRASAGLCLAALDLWLDPVGPISGGDAFFLSHVHAVAPSGERAANSPHVRVAAPGGSALRLASFETLRLMRALDLERGADRAAGCGTERGLGWGEALSLPIRAAFGGGTARLTIAPAGHVLGGSQLVVEHPRGRLVYTGDWSGESDPTRAAGQVVGCDEVVMTSAFGLPLFRFDRIERVLAELADWCAACLAEDVTPAVLVQTPGPAQAVVRALNERGLAVVAWDEVRRACDAYEAMGRPTGAVGACGPAKKQAAIVAPASLRAGDLALPKRSAVAYASGWAVLDAAVGQKRADVAFALADTADYDRLISLVAMTAAKTAYVVRGEARALAHELRRRGVDAHALDLPAIDDRGSA